MILIPRGGIRTLLLLPVWFSLALRPGPFQGVETRPSTATNLEGEVDRLFASWDRPDSAGAAVVVIQRGEVVFKKGYGMANLEWNIPNTPRTVFCIGSVSKQFTAYAVALLASRGRLDLDDDIRQHIPEMPDYGIPITVSDLIHHTSGLRDDQMLLYLGDWEQGELHGAQAVIDRILVRQKALLFPPGSSFDYSNSNYCLLGEIVRRASGQSLREFARVNMFEPLGMKNTFFLDDFREVVKGRAWGYLKKSQGGYHAYIDTNDQVGAGGVHTTVEDMVLWNSNFETARIGGPEVIRRVLAPGRLRNGESVPYGFGLELDSFKGLRVVKHDGSYGGYRAMFLRFPDEGFAVFCAANAGDLDTRVMCYRIAKLCLGDRLTENPPVRPRPVRLDPEALRRLAGDYRDSKNMDLLTVSASADRLLCRFNDDPCFEYVPVEGQEFRAVTLGWTIILKPATAPGGSRPEIRAFQNGKLSRLYEPIDRAAPSAEELAEYAGAYFSEELSATYLLEVGDGKLYVRFKRAPRSPLKPMVKDQFAAWPLIFDFERDARGQVAGFRLGKIGPDGIPFRRMR